MSKHLTTRNERELEQREQQRWMAPLVDVYENNQEWRLVADVPGVGQGDVQLHLDKSELTIEAKRNIASEGAAIAHERVSAGFRRVFELPAGVDVERVSAELRQGVVTIHLPKTEALKPRRIEVRAG